MEMSVHMAHVYAHAHVHAAMQSVHVCARAQALRKREAALLEDGHGACFELLPASGHLRPWGQVTVAVSVHSNMWGLYEDMLVSELDGLPPVQLPLAVGVVGLPLRLHDATVGLTSRQTPPLLSWAPAAIGAAPIQKTIRVMNNGSAEAQLTWALVHVPDPNRPLQAEQP